MKIKLIKAGIITSMCLASVSLFSCKNKNTPVLSTEELIVYNEEVNTSMDVYISPKQSSTIIVPVSVNKMYSNYRSYYDEENTNLYLNSFHGNNISDIKIDTIRVDVWNVIRPNTVEFYLTISANDNWDVNIVGRSITSIDFVMLEKLYTVPVDITIKDASKSNMIATECPILNDNEYFKDVDINYLHEGSFNISFDYTGWGATDFLDPEYATIKRFEFLDNKLKFDSLSIEYLSGEDGDNSIYTTIECNPSNIDYKLNTGIRFENKIMYSSYVRFDVVVTKNDDFIDFEYVNDTLVLVYTLNEEEEEYKVNVRNIRYNGWNEFEK